MPRPPIQHHRFFLEVERDTQEFLSEMMDKQLQAKAIGAAGRAGAGLLGNETFVRALLLAMALGAGVAITQKLGSLAADTSMGIWRGILGSVGGEEAQTALDTAWAQTKQQFAQIPILGEIYAFFGLGAVSENSEGSYRDAVDTNAENKKKAEELLAKEGRPSLFD